MRASQKRSFLLKHSYKTRCPGALHRCKPQQNSLQCSGRKLERVLIHLFGPFFSFFLANIAFPPFRLTFFSRTIAETRKKNASLLDFAWNLHVESQVIISHHVRVWRRSLRWTSWLLSSPPARLVSALSHPELSWPVPTLPPHLTRPPSCPPCHLDLGCAAPGCGKPSQQSPLQL